MAETTTSAFERLAPWTLLLCLLFANLSVSEDCAWTFVRCTNATPFVPQEKRLCSCDDSPSASPSANGSFCYRQSNSVWSTWEPWSLWGPVCIQGASNVSQTRQRVRSCSPCTDCSGSDIDVQARQNCCPIDGNWGQWSALHASATCGNVTRRRARQCDGHACGGKPCDGDYSETNTSYSCCPTDGTWGEWTFHPWSASCGYVVRVKTRKCEGAECGGVNHCEGDNDESEFDTICCPVDGGWSVVAVGNWSSECGNISRTVKRNCTDPSPNECGKDCKGSSVYLEERITPCPTTPMPLTTAASTPVLLFSPSRGARGGSISHLHPAIVASLIAVPVILSIPFFIWVVVLVQKRNQPRPRKHRGKIHATRAVSIRGSFRKIASRFRPKTPRETNNEIYEESNQTQVPLNTFSSHTTLGNPAYIFGEPPKQGLQNMRTPTPIQVSPSPAPPSSHYVESTQPYYHDVEDHKDSSDDTHSNATLYETLSKYDQKQLRYPNHVATMPLAGANASPVVESIKYASMKSRPSFDGSIASSGHSENALLPGNVGTAARGTNPLFKIEIGSQDNDEGRNLTGYEPMHRPSENHIDKISQAEHQSGEGRNSTIGYEKMYRPSDIHIAKTQAH